MLKDPTASATLLIEAEVISPGPRPGMRPRAAAPDCDVPQPPIEEIPDAALMQALTFTANGLAG